MLSGLIKFHYRISKPIVKTANTRNLQAYRKQMHEARVRINKEAVEYLNRIEDNFLAEHQFKMQQKHYANACAFRSRISRLSYELDEELKKQQSKHEERLQRIENYVRREEVKQLNRKRLTKILEYESKESWLHGERINELDIAEWVLPEYIGTTEYYHKLQSQALAYEQLDFDILHKYSSSEESLHYKNKLLAPTFKDMLAAMRKVKFSEEDIEAKNYVSKTAEIHNNFGKNEELLKAKLQELKVSHEKTLKQLKQKYSDPGNKTAILFSKIQDLALLFKKWKEYADILSMTSVQIQHKLIINLSENDIHQKKIVLEKEIDKNRDKTFTNTAEEDTEDEEVSLSKFISKNSIKKEEKISIEPTTQSSNQIENLIKNQEDLFKELEKQLSEFKVESEEPSPMVQVAKKIDEEIAANEALKIDEAHLEPNETTSSIEVLKEKFAENKNMINLLNIIGEIQVPYPKLFKKIWDTQYL